MHVPDIPNEQSHLNSAGFAQSVTFTPVHWTPEPDEVALVNPVAALVVDLLPPAPDPLPLAVSKTTFPPQLAVVDAPMTTTA